MNLSYKKKKQFLITFTLCFGLMTAFFAGKNQMQANATAQGINARYRTAQEIRSYVASNSASIRDNFTFITDPYTEVPYNLGRLTDATQQSALNMLNQIRFIAGIADNVTISTQFAEYAQAAALVQYINGQISHNPDQPYSMGNTMFQMAQRGAAGSNNSWATWGNRSLNETILNSWMGNADSVDISALEERRWLLNPRLKQTGFGVVSGLKGTFSSAYVNDMTNTTANETGVAWPARTMPVEYFAPEYPWSYSVGYAVNANDLEVTLLRYRDYKTWRFSHNGSSDGELYVNNNAYGQPGCIIFRPTGIGEYKSGDSFQVRINGSGLSLSYNVEFFNLGLPRITYTTNFDSQGGTAVSSIVTEELGTINPLPVPVKSGTEFLGWYTSPNGQGVRLTETTLISKNQTYYAYWKDTKSVNSLTLTYNGLKYAGANVSDGLVVQANYSSGTSERVYGYSLSQKTLANGQNRIVVSYGGVTETIYINVGSTLDNTTQPTVPTEVDTDYHDIFFHANGGKNLNYQKISLATGDILDAMPTVERANYKFKGWYTKPSGGRKISRTTIPNSDCVLYAQWIRITKPKQISAPSFASNENGQLKVRYDALSGVDGYEISYSTSKDFSSNTKKVSANYATKTLKNLKRGTIYYVRVRAYKVDSMERKIYGKYSVARGVKVS